jgi:hypothetical protein
MRTHLVANGRPARRRPRVGTRTDLRQLGWAHYWLLVSVLAAGLALFVLILFAYLPRP